MNTNKTVDLTAFTTRETQIARIKKTSKTFVVLVCAGFVAGKKAYAYTCKKRGETIERLYYVYNKSVTQIFESKYISGIAFCGRKLIFSVLVNDYSELYMYDGNSVVKLYNSIGRIKNIRADCSYSLGLCFTYECRKGKKSFIGYCFKQDDSIPASETILELSFNAYDAHIAFSNNLYIVYSAFDRGNYYIYLTILATDNTVLKKNIQISDMWGAGFAPSVCARQEGGVYICYHSNSQANEFQKTYLQTPKYLARRSLFTNYTHIFACVYNDGLFSLSNSSGLNAQISNTFGGKFACICEVNNKPFLIYRQYEFDRPLWLNASICIIDLTSKSNNLYKLSSHGYGENYVNFVCNNNLINFAFIEDNRQTGWEYNGEWFDTQNTLRCVGVLLSVKTTSHVVALHPYILSYGNLQNIEEENLPSKNSDYAGKEENLPSKNSDYICAYAQLHVHSQVSVCARLFDQTPDFNYRFCIDVQHLSVVAITDHCYNMWYIDEYWDKKNADFYNFDGEFVAIHAYEWSGFAQEYQRRNYGGHANIFLFDEGEQKVYMPETNYGGVRTLLDLYKAYDGKKVLVIPHHTADASATFNFEYCNDKLSPVAEILQDSGQYLNQSSYGKGIVSWADSKIHPQCFASDALVAGHHIGFIGAGDHVGLALAGLFLKELTRAGVYDCIKSRRTFASSSIEIDVDFTGNLQKMGSIIRESDCNFDLQIASPQQIELVLIYKNNQIVETITVNDSRFSKKWSVHCDSEEFWYVGIVYNNREVVWLSPIWVGANFSKGESVWKH